MVMNLRGQNMDWSTQKMMKKEPSEDGQSEDRKTIDSSEINRKLGQAEVGQKRKRKS